MLFNGTKIYSIGEIVLLFLLTNLTMGSFSSVNDVQVKLRRYICIEKGT